MEGGGELTKINDPNDTAKGAADLVDDSLCQARDTRARAPISCSIHIQGGTLRRALLDGCRRTLEEARRHQSPAPIAGL